MFFLRTLQRSKILITLILACVALLFGFLFAKFWHGSNSIFISGRNPVSQLASFVFDGQELIGEKEGRVNILLLGVGGPGHDGPYLSDTIVVASVRPTDGEVSLISIPRDILVTIPGSVGKYKINSAYAYGVMNYGEKIALSQARKTVEHFLGMEIPYAVVVDFTGFKKAIDTVGGVDVEIDKTFTDSTFPDTRNGYLPAVTFKAGIEHMDGGRALIYARSRHTTSDFDRARRQQRIIEAFKAKLRELNLFRDARTVNGLFNDFTGHVSTNLDAGQIKRLGQMSADIPANKISTLVLDPTTGLFCSYLSRAQGYHINICPGKTEKDVFRLAETVFARGHVLFEKPNIEIQNATNVSGLAAAASEQLLLMGFKTSFANASRLADSSTTTIYDLTNGAKPDSLAVLMVTLGGKLGQGPPPPIKAGTNPDFIVVLGRNYQPPYLEIINLDPPEPEEDEEGDGTSDEDDETAADDDGNDDNQTKETKSEKEDSTIDQESTEN